MDSFRVDRIERDRGKGGEPPEEPPSKEKLKVIAFLLQTFQRVIDVLLQRPSKEIHAQDRKSTRLNSSH